MPMSPRLLRPIASGVHPEAAAWRSAVLANGGSVSASTVKAVSTFCAAIEAAGIRDRFYRLNLFAGTGLNAALVPLYRGPTYGGTTYGNATDTNNGPFVSGDYSLASGLAGNGSSKYLDTGYPANTLAASNSHLGLGLLVTDTVGSASRTGIGAWNGGANVLELRLRDGAGAVPLASAFTRYGTVGDRFGDNVTSSPLNAGNITSAWPTMYRNGVASGTVATSSQDFPAAVDVFVLALNNDGSGASNISNARIGYYSIGATMTAVQAASYSDAIDAFYASIGRS